jgi:hypothetical protein
VQHDVGTRLLKMGPVQQAAELRRLRAAGDEPLAALAAGPGDAVYARLRDDVDSGRGNVALWHARRAADAAAGWEALADSLAYFAQLYAQHHAWLGGCLAELDAGSAIGGRAR